MEVSGHLHGSGRFASGQRTAARLSLNMRFVGVQSWSGRFGQETKIFSCWYVSTWYLGYGLDGR
jgi:hypothetical protein